jgi:hypothetical protein
MSHFSQRIRADVEQELRRAEDFAQAGDASQAFHHLERAHVLGQASTRHHVRAHWHMLRWGWRQRDWRECRGQLLRLVGAASKTALGWVPRGNTGGANISPFCSLPLPADLAAAIARARQR